MGELLARHGGKIADAVTHLRRRSHPAALQTRVAGGVPVALVSVCLATNGVARRAAARTGSMNRGVKPDAGPRCAVPMSGRQRAREAARLLPSCVSSPHGRERLRGDALRERLAVTDLIVTTYPTGTPTSTSSACYDGKVVLDEAQATEQPLADRQGHERLRAAHRCRADRHPGENRCRTVVDHGFSIPGCSARRSCSATATPFRGAARATDPPSGCGRSPAPTSAAAQTDPAIIDDLRRRSR